MIKLRRPHEDELPDLTALCLRSKAHWGYDDKFMAACVEEMTLHPADGIKTHLRVAEDEQGYIGVAWLALTDDKTTSIEAMFVEPARMGIGAGRLLYRWIVETSREMGADTLMIDADPNAAPFYRHMGAYDVGETPSGSIPGRMLPLLRHDL